MTRTLPNLRHTMTSEEARDLHRTLVLLEEYIYPLLYERQGGKCACCGVPDENMDIDHKVYHPMVSINELQLLRRPCHIAKHPEKQILKHAPARTSRLPSAFATPAADSRLAPLS